MEGEEIAGLVSVFILLLLVSIIIVLFIVFVKRKNKLLEEQTKAKEAFERELAETQIEIREATLRNISWELHDNIGQIMTLAKIQVEMAKDKPELLTEAYNTIGDAVNELRTLSRLINPEAIKSLTLEEALATEVARFNRLNFIESTFKMTGSPLEIDSNTEIIIFRILQEFFSNTIKHSKASHLNVVLAYGEEVMHITAEDDGVGFEDNDEFIGIGLKNMKNRAQLVGAVLKLSSGKGKGTALALTFQKKKG